MGYFILNLVKNPVTVIALEILEKPHSMAISLSVACPVICLRVLMICLNDCIGNCSGFGLMRREVLQIEGSSKKGRYLLLSGITILVVFVTVSGSSSESQTNLRQ